MDHHQRWKKMEKCPISRHDLDEAPVRAAIPGLHQQGGRVAQMAGGRQQLFRRKASV